MTELQGRVFTRKAAYEALPEDVREQTAEAQKLLTEKKAEVFTIHHSGLVKVPQSVRGKELVDFLEQWIKPEETEKEADAEVKSEETSTDKQEVTETEEKASKTEEAAKTEEEAATTEEEAAKTEEEAAKTEDEAAKTEEAVKTEEEVKSDEKTEENVKSVEEAPKNAESPKKVKSPKNAKKEKKKVEAPSPYYLRAKEIAEALVLSGFITSYKDRVKAEAPKEYVTNNELFVPLSEVITESKDTTVWNALDGAIYAAQLKRKAGVFSAFTQGKDVYVVANETTKKIYFFESDVARVALAEYAGSDGFIHFDSAHFQFGVKLVYGDKFELLNLVTKENQESFVHTVLKLGGQYREMYNLAAEEIESFYELKDFSMDKKEVLMKEYKGKVVLVVNVSSKCGLTPTNYPELQQLHEKYHEQGLVILGFPCNQFAGQEPGTHDEIIEFVKQYNVTFPLLEKHDVNGSNARPVFTYLKAKLPGTFGHYVEWNFTKFLVDRNGQPFKRYGPRQLPLSFEEDIKELLAKAPEPEKTEEETKEEEVESAEVEETTAQVKEEKTEEESNKETEEKTAQGKEEETTSVEEGEAVTTTEKKEDAVVTTEETKVTSNTDEVTEEVKQDDVAVSVS